MRTRLLRAVPSSQFECREGVYTPHTSGTRADYTITPDVPVSQLNPGDFVLLGESDVTDWNSGISALEDCILKVYEVTESALYCMDPTLGVSTYEVEHFPTWTRYIRN